MKLRLFLVPLFLVLANPVFGQTPSLVNSETRLRSPGYIKGVELSEIKGWFANIYPWGYDPETSTVHPVPSLWDPPKWDPIEKKYIPQQQSPAQIIEQARLLDEYGSGADVLEFNVCPDNPDYNYWLSSGYLKSGTIKRPFFVLYEHIHGNCNYVEFNGSKNMNLAKNRRAFLDDIGFFVNNVVLPNESRYVTVNGRAVIYLWATVGMEGDFASLLQTAKMMYPVFFIGSVNIMAIPQDRNVLKNLQALDGFMEYAIPVFDKDGNGLPKPDNYMTMIQKYDYASRLWFQMMKKFESETGNKYLFIRTFQAAYDDTKLSDRDNPPMYPRTKAEMEHHAEVINRRTKSIKDTCPEGVEPYAGDKNNCFEDFYDNSGPHIVATELPEGAAVIESQCLPETIDIPNVKFVGCGKVRLEIPKKYFSN